MIGENDVDVTDVVLHKGRMWDIKMGYLTNSSHSGQTEVAFRALQGERIMWDIRSHHCVGDNVGY